MSDASRDRQAFNLLCDEEIGSGASRVTYSSKLLPQSVIKVEDRANHFQNVVEWELWKRAVDLGISGWFAECQHISSDGLILVQERTRPAAPSEYPKKVPAFLGDFKRSNFGMVPTRGKDKFVCHDYGHTYDSLKYGLATKRMITPKWWDED